MAGRFTVPQNPMVAELSGLSGGRQFRGNGMGKLGRIGQTACSSAYSPGNCVSAGGYYDDDNEVCVCPTGNTPVIPSITTPSGTTTATTTPITPSGTTTACATNPCSWTDYIWASTSCLNWYAQCNPTSPFYVANTQGALAALGSTAGSAVGSTAGGLFAGLAGSLGIPTWAIYAVLGLVAYKMVTK